MTSITAELFSPGKYSDLLIKCKGKEFRVHRAVVCLQSKPLADAIDGRFKEATTGEIDLDGNELDIVECMLQFMYNRDYSDGRDNDVGTTPSTSLSVSVNTQGAPSSNSSLPSSGFTPTAKSLSEVKGALLTNTKVYIIGDQLQVPELKTLSMKKYEEVVSAGWNSASFVASLKLLYEETMENDRLLKDVVIKTAGEHVKDLCDRGEFVTLCKEKGEIAFDVLKASLTAEPSVTACPFCLQLTNVSHSPPSQYQYYGRFYCSCCGRHFN
ncbi:hypothetical protein DL98DRAFT_216253 [Cadophora sp. DSE1049]|nr:hypothetical protein DL98DRAFT_216253 [Cadophora sp. DSE1049]